VSNLPRPAARYKPAWQNAQFTVTPEGDLHGRVDAGMGNWLILRDELRESRWLKIAARAPDVNFRLFVEALHKAMAMQIARLEKRARIKDS
jgi:hypothetical protein